jgi:hypothetical protein
MSRALASGRPVLKALRPSGAKAAARQDTLLSFLARESPSTLPASPFDLPLGPFASTSNSNPFAPTKLPEANSWTPPKYSIRRQKVLRKLAKEALWPEDALPPSVDKISPAAATRAPQLYRASPHIPATKVLDEVELEKKGPYAGRKGAAFKGKIWERKFEARQAELNKALQLADEKAAAWKKVSSSQPASAKGVRDGKLTLTRTSTEQGRGAQQEQASTTILDACMTMELGDVKAERKFSAQGEYGDPRLLGLQGSGQLQNARSDYRVLAPPPAALRSTALASLAFRQGFARLHHACESAELLSEAEVHRRSCETHLYTTTQQIRTRRPNSCSTTFSHVRPLSWSFRRVLPSLAGSASTSNGAQLPFVSAFRAQPQTASASTLLQDGLFAISNSSVAPLSLSSELGLLAVRASWLPP